MFEVTVKQFVMDSADQHRPLVADSDGGSLQNGTVIHVDLRHLPYLTVLHFQAKYLRKL